VITTDSTKAVPYAETLFTKLNDGEAVLLHLETHAYYGLNRTGAQIWQLMTDGRTLGEICAKLEEQFDVSQEQIQQHVLAFARELSTAKLVQLLN
jgi:hypothetical protein